VKLPKSLKTLAAKGFLEVLFCKLLIIKWLQNAQNSRISEQLAGC
jgi:hypothetical protein